MHITQTLFFTSMLADGQHSPDSREAHSHPNGSESLTRALIRMGNPLETLIMWLTYSNTVSLKYTALMGYLKRTADADEKLLCVYTPQSRKVMLSPEAATEKRLSHRV